MALMDENGSNGFYMPVAPAYSNGNGNGNGNNSNGFGQDGWWIILLFIFLAALGNGFGGGFGGGGAQPIIMTDGASGGSVQRGFDQAALMTGIDGVQAGINGISTQICNGFSGVTAAVTGAQNAIAQQLYSNQIASMQGMNSLSAQLAQCCCDNRLATAGLQSTIQAEGCANRESLNYATRDILNNQTAGIQRILDQLCADKIDAKNDTIAQLRQELAFARAQASQDVQTAQILAGQTSEVDALYNRLNNCPVNTVPVYGRQPIFTCGNNCNNGCGCNSGCGY